MSKKIVSFSLIGLSMFILSGCSSKEVTIENKQPVKYEVLGKATDIKVTESWTYAFVGTIYTTKMTATAYPKK